MTDINEMLDLDQKPIMSDLERQHLREMAMQLLTDERPKDGVALVIAAGLEALE